MAPWIEWQASRSCWRVWVDGSYSQEQRSAGIAAVIRDPSGRMMCRETAHLPARNSTHAELLAVQLGVQTLHDIIGNRKLMEPWKLYSDCRSIPEILSGRGSGAKADPSVLASIQAECGEMEAFWIPRRENRDADQCAQRATRLAIGSKALVPRSHPTAWEKDQLEQRNRLMRAQRKILQQQHRQWKSWQLSLSR